MGQPAGELGAQVPALPADVHLAAVGVTARRHLLGEVHHLMVHQPLDSGGAGGGTFQETQEEDLLLGLVGVGVGQELGHCVGCRVVTDFVT